MKDATLAESLLRFALMMCQVITSRGVSKWIPGRLIIESILQVLAEPSMR